MLVAAIAGLIGIVLMHSVGFAALGILIILAATTDYWLPIRYRVDEGGCSMRCGLSVSSIEWDKVKRIVLDEEGAKVSPLADSSRLAPFRGVLLRFAGNREEVEKALHRFAGQHVRFLEGGPNAGAGGDAHRPGGAGDKETENGDARDPDARDA